MRQIVSAVALLSVTACAPRPAVDPTKFEGAYRSAKAVDAALTVGNGVSVQRYTELVHELGTEISILKDRLAGETEAALAAQFDEVLDAYSDAAFVWDLKLAARGDRIYSGPTLEERLKPHPVRYHNDGDMKFIEADATMQFLWKTAGAKLEAASARLHKREAD